MLSSELWASQGFVSGIQKAGRVRGAPEPAATPPAILSPFSLPWNRKTPPTPTHYPAHPTPSCVPYFPRLRLPHLRPPHLHLHRSPRASTWSAPRASGPCGAAWGRPWREASSLEVSERVASRASPVGVGHGRVRRRRCLALCFGSFVPLPASKASFHVGRVRSRVRPVMLSAPAPPRLP